MIIHMEKEFIPYQEALELKALGFDEPCIRGWDKDGKVWYHPDSDVILDNPTFSQAFRWFREKYGLFHSIEIYPIREERDRCWYVIHRVEKNEFDVFERNHAHMSGFFDNYSQAENGCLRKLIEIVKTK